jgi:transposase
VTGAETWLFHLISESKQESLEWHHTHSPTVKKYRTFLTKKIMAAVFWDCKGVLLVDFMCQGTTTNASAYFETLKRLRCTIQNRRQGILRCSICNDNARTHTTRAVQQLLQSFNWEVLYNPTHSPDLAPSDFLLCLHIKKHLACQKFHNDEQVDNKVTMWLHAQVADFSDIKIQKLIPRLNRCLDKGDNYVKK